MKRSCQWLTMVAGVAPLVTGGLHLPSRRPGTGRLSIYTRNSFLITIPAIYICLGFASMAALATLEFTWIFKDHLWALILVQHTKLKPVTTGLASLLGEYMQAYNIQFAGTLIAVIPTVVLFMFLQRFFIQGLTMGSGK